MTSTLDLSKEFVGRRALVTGGSRGIGAAIAQRLLDGGATVVVAARSPHEQMPKAATFVAADLTKRPAVEALAKAAIDILGGIDILVNNAAAARVFPHGIATIPDEEWQDALDANFLSAVRLTHAVLPALTQSTSGAIVNISSGGLLPLPSVLAHYGASKAALDAYSRTLAKELASHKIRVNIVTPGHVITPGADETRNAIAKGMGVPPAALFSGIPLGRPGQPMEVAELVAFLVSGRGQWITGHKYFVDGGIGEL